MSPHREHHAASSDQLSFDLAVAPPAPAPHDLPLPAAGGRDSLGTASTLADQPARDRARGDIEVSFAVSAGAGAGKTETLIRRLQRALEAGCEADRLVAITFTDRAARDLVNKLRAKLPHEYLPDIERMSVGTIHSFCLSILRRHPLEAGLPPVFTTQDELLSGTDIAERVRRIRNTFFDGIAERDDAVVREALDVVMASNGMFHLDDLIRLIDRQWDRFEEVAFAPEEPWHGACRAALARIAAITADAGVPATLRAKLLEMHPAITAFSACTSMAEALACVPVPSLSTTGGAVGKPTRDEVKALVHSLDQTIVDCALRTMLHDLVPVVLHEAEDRYRGGHVSFDDILVLTRRLLRARPELCGRLRTEISHLCIDEFQDTDVVQFDIVEALTEPLPGAHTPVLFAVGDPKQSVYGFRDADVELFARLAERADVTPLLLSTNFRSRPEILEWMNSTFSAWFESPAAAGQVPFDPLIAHVPSAPAEVLVLGDAMDASALVVAQAQADDIARAVTVAHDSWMCRHDDSAEPRKALYRDIAVLIRARTELTHLEPALRRAGIPYVIEGGALLYDSREPRDLLRVLAAVSDSASPITLVNALRTSVLAISDVELLEHRGAGGTWNVYGDADRPGHPAVLAAMAQLRRWSDARHRIPVPDLLAEVASATLSHAASLVDEAPTTTWRRLRIVIDEARWWFEQTGGSLGDYLAWIAMRVDNNDRSNVTTNETDEDAVHILTVHAAKGLEFPVVVVTGLGRQRPPDNHVRASFEDTPRGAVAAIKMGRLQTKNFTSIDERTLATLESARLTYVACTRARDHLVVCLHRRASGSTAAAEMAAHVPPASDAPELPGLALMLRPPVTELSNQLDHPDQRRATWRMRSSWSATQLRHHNQDTDDAAHPPVHDAAPAIRTVGQIGRADRNDPNHPDDRLDPDERPEAERLDGPRTEAGLGSIHNKPARPFAALPDQIGRYGTRVGRAVHGVVQTVSLRTPREGLADRVRQHCVAEEVPDRFHAYVNQLCESIIDSEVFARMAAAAEVTTLRREMYVGGWVTQPASVDPANGDPEGGEGIYGIIDAVWMEQGRFVVVDFKTDHVLESAEVLAVRYRGQLEAYAKALRAATGRDVAEMLLCVALPAGSPAVTITL